MREVVDEVGADAVRFIMLMRKNDATLDFDLAKVIEQSQDNPVFYVQYAHARACSILRQAAMAFPDLDQSPAALAKADFRFARGRERARPDADVSRIIRASYYRRRKPGNRTESRFSPMTWRRFFMRTGTRVKNRHICGSLMKKA